MLLVINSLSISAFAGMGQAHEAGSGPSQVIDRSRDTRVAADDTDGNTDNSTVPIPDGSKDVSIDTWEALYVYLTDPEIIDGNKCEHCLNLEQDCIFNNSKNSNQELVIPSGSYVTIDLQGNILNRGFTASKTNSQPSTGSVLKVSEGAVLKIIDSSGESNPGTIGGGYGYQCSGGIHNLGTLIIEGGQIGSKSYPNFCTTNVSTPGGAGVGNLGTMIMNGGTICNNKVTNGLYSNGGGIYNSGNLIMNGGEINGNTGFWGGGISNCKTGTVNIYGGSICKNTTASDSYHGAGIYNRGGTVTIKECSITGNQTSASGGGIYSETDSDSTAYLNIEGGTIQGNSAGRQQTSSDSSLKYGGGICVNSGVLNLKGGTITGNKAKNNCGRAGGIYVAEGATMNVEGFVTVKDNEAVLQDNAGNPNNAIGANIVVEPTGVINVTGELAEDSELCLYPIVDNSWQLPAANNNFRVFTSGLKALSAASLGSVDNFTSEVEGTAVGINDEGEVYVGVAERTVHFSSGLDGITVTNPEKTFPADSYFILPECAYTADTDIYDFSGWKVDNEEGLRQPGDNFQLSGELVEVKAQFDDKSNESDFELQSVSMLSTGMLGVNFYLRLPCPDLDGTETQEAKDAAVQQHYQNATMAFSISSAGEAKDRITKSAVLDTASKNSTGKYYGFTCNITSVQMADTITATFTYQDPFAENPDDSAASKTITKTYSIRQYLNSLDMSGSEYSEAAKTLIKAMADYGYYVQPYLAGANGWTIGEDYKWMDKRYTDSYDMDSILDEMESLKGYTSRDDRKTEHDIVQLDYTLKFDSGIDIVVFFTPSESYTGNPAVSIDGESVTEVSDFDTEIADKTTYYAKLDDGKYVLVYSGLSADQLNDLHKFQLQTDFDTEGKTDGYGITYLEVTGLCFAEELVKNGDSDTRNFGAALYNLYKAAAAFSEQN